MSIQEVKDLVKQEKETEERLREAEKEAAVLIEKAKASALNIMQEAEEPGQYESIFRMKSEAIEEKKRQAERETTEEIERIQTEAKKNLKKTVALIINRVLCKEL